MILSGNIVLIDKDGHETFYYVDHDWKKSRLIEQKTGRIIQLPDKPFHDLENCIVAEID